MERKGCKKIGEVENKEILVCGKEEEKCDHRDEKGELVYHIEDVGLTCSQTYAECDYCGEDISELVEEEEISALTKKDLFREFLSYPSKEDLKLFEDKKRLEKLELLVMGWIEEDVNWIVKEYEEITKNWWEGAKEQAKINLNKFLSGRAELI